METETPGEPTATRPRDRAATQLMLVEAARAVLAADGFQGLGINAVARQAGCDKQLIYRYFGGLDGLVDAIGQGIAENLRARLQPFGGPLPPASYRELIERMMLGFLEVLRGDPLTRRILAWEVASPSDLVRRLTAARSRAMGIWVMQSRGSLTPPAGVDAPAVNALLLAAIQHLALSGAGAGEFSGLALRTDADWDRARAAVRAMVAAVYAE